MKRWRLLNKKRNIDKLKKDFNVKNDRVTLEFNIREIVKEELLSATNSLRVGIYRE
jgi:hypothetical protein